MNTINIYHPDYFLYIHAVLHSDCQISSQLLDMPNAGVDIMAGDDKNVGWISDGKGFSIIIFTLILAKT